MEAQAETVTFFEVFEAEVAAVNARRLHFAPLAAKDDPDAWAVQLTRRPTPDERHHSIAVPVTALPLVGLALSGGGVRSAAFCLGVLQGLDAVKDDRDPQVFDAVDYLSTVSGGGYIGTSLVAGYMQTRGRFPFASKLDQQETIETQHIRDYSNYLAPSGLGDWLVGVVVLVRGLLINAMIFLCVILFGALLTVTINSTEAQLRGPHFGLQFGAFQWSAAALAILLCGQVVYAIISTRTGWISLRSLRERERAGHLFVLLLVVLGGIVFLEAQAFVLAALFDADHLARGSSAGVYGVGHKLGALWSTLAAAAVGVVGFGSKLVTVARATVGDDSWSGTLKHLSSRAVVYLAAVVVPLLLWVTYLAFCFWAIGWLATPQAAPSFPQTPAWLFWLAGSGGGTPGFAGLYLIATAILFVLSVLVTPNASSLHIYYRDRLSRAFLWQRDKLERDILRQEGESQAPSLLHEVRAYFGAGQQDRSADVDTFLLSSLKQMGDPAQADPRAFAPFSIINTAVNLEGSKYLNRRGRNADSFFFSPLHVGSEATGYVPTTELESLDPNLNLATAMAISGAAASANMGASTIRALTFSLAALNVRLGYWLYNPRRVPHWAGRVPPVAKIGPAYFTLETFGQLNEWSENVYLTDGGHFDNLGLYELLKRRCTVIVAADAEADPPLNFESLVRLQRYARIDLGVLIELPWEALRSFNKTITVDSPHGPTNSPEDCVGPHIALGRIQYGPDEVGVLIYVKSCLSGDEGDLIRDYRRRNPEFPHETTLDQFFSEEQFEVYRALGFHATKSFFVGRDHFAFLPPSPDFPDWPETVERALHRLNVADDAIERIIRRQRGGR